MKNDPGNKVGITHGIYIFELRISPVQILATLAVASSVKFAKW